MTLRALFRDVGLIAAFDLRESLRTRRALMLIVLYLAAASLSAYIYLQIVHKSEEALAGALAAQRGVEGQGIGTAIAAGLARDQAYRKALSFFAGGDASTVDYLASMPPVVLVFLWSSLTFLPWIVALTSYDQVAADVHLRTVRYTILRTSRGALILGKLGAQVLLFSLVSAVAALPFFLLGWRYLDSFDPVATGSAMLAAWPFIALYAMAFLGIASMASQLSNSPSAARALCLLAMLGLWILGLLHGLGGSDKWYSLLAYLGYASPWAYKDGFFRADWYIRAASAAICLAIGAGYAALGYWRFRDKDL